MALRWGDPPLFHGRFGVALANPIRVQVYFKPRLSRLPIRRNVRAPYGRGLCIPGARIMCSRFRSCRVSLAWAHSVPPGRHAGEFPSTAADRPLGPVGSGGPS